MASRDALVLGLIAAGGLGAYVISQRGQDGEAAEPEAVEAGYIDPLTGLPGIGASDVWGATGFQEPGVDAFIQPGSPDDPYFVLARDQGDESLAIQRDGERSRTRAAWTDTAILGGAAGIVAGSSVARAVRERRAARPAASGSVRNTRFGGATRSVTTTQASRPAASVTQRVTRAARTVARSPVVRTAGRVAGRVAAPVAVVASAAGGVKTGQQALQRGYTKPQATALVASDAALRVATLGTVKGSTVLKARNKIRNRLRGLF